MKYFLILFILFSSFSFSDEKNFGIGVGLGQFRLGYSYSFSPYFENYSINFEKEIEMDFSFSYYLKDFEFESKYISHKPNPYITVGSSLKIDISSILFNAKFEPCVNRYCVYIGGGFNISKMKVEGLYAGPYESKISKATKIGYQGVCGFLYKFSSLMNFYSEYIYFHNTGPDVEAPYDVNLKMNILSVGLKYKL